MENQVASPRKTILNYGLILGIISVFIGVIMYVTDTYLQPHWSMGVVSFLISVIIIVMAIKTFKKENAGFLSLGEALKVGLGVALIGGIIGALWIFVLTNVLVTDYADQMAELQREVMLEQFPDMTEASMNQAMEMNAKFTGPWMQSAFSIIGSLFFGFLIALIAGLVMKNKRPYEI